MPPIFCRKGFFGGYLCASQRAKRIHIHTHTYIHTRNAIIHIPFMHTYINTHAHEHTHTRTRTHMHPHMHAHAHIHRTARACDCGQRVQGLQGLLCLSLWCGSLSDSTVLTMLILLVLALLVLSFSHFSVPLSPFTHTHTQIPAGYALLEDNPNICTVFTLAFQNKQVTSNIDTSCNCRQTCVMSDHTARVQHKAHVKLTSHQ